MRLAGERLLVTGSTSGIGKHVAILCAREGAAVVDTITAAGGEAVFLSADLADERACTDLVETAAARLGGLTVLVNNAAIASGGQSPVGTLDSGIWERVLRVNL